MIPTWTTEEADAITSRTRPPQFVIDACARAAALSPCMKSNRGSVIYSPEEAERWATGVDDLRNAPVDSFIVASGYNSPPADFRCTRNSICRKACGEICVHAEERAIRAAGCLMDLQDLELVHIKVQKFPAHMKDEKMAHTKIVETNGVYYAPVATGSPSCVTCARTIADTKLSGVWLWEFPGKWDEMQAPVWRFYDPATFYERSCNHERNNLPYARAT